MKPGCWTVDDICLFLRTHFHDEFATLHYVGMHDVGLVVGFAVEFHGTYVHVFRRIVDGFDYKFAAGNSKFRFIPHGRTKPVTA